MCACMRDIPSGYIKYVTHLNKMNQMSIKQFSVNVAYCKKNANLNNFEIFLNSFVLIVSVVTIGLYLSLFYEFCLIFEELC